MGFINYTIIIPHKNIPQLLQRCIDSIPIREDLQIIIVDDNSDAVHVDFTHFPGQERHDTKIIFDKSGKGPGHARNIGLEKAEGKWILFADADDFFNYCITDILNQYSDSDADIIFCNANSIDSDSYINSVRSYPNNEFINMFFDKGHEWQLRYEFGEPWAKIISHQLILENQVVFDETPIHNDTRFSYLIGYYAKSIIADRRALYCVTTRRDSLSLTIDNAKFTARHQVMAERVAFLEAYHLQYNRQGLYLLYLAALFMNHRRKEYRQALKIYGDKGIDTHKLRQLVWKYSVHEYRNIFFRKIIAFFSKHM
jgi:glycosyltransferase involved in cell wall biosynthesis